MTPLSPGLVTLAADLGLRLKFERGDGGNLCLFANARTPEHHSVLAVMIATCGGLAVARDSLRADAPEVEVIDRRAPVADEQRQRDIVAERMTRELARVWACRATLIVHERPAVATLEVS